MTNGQFGQAGSRLVTPLVLLLAALLVLLSPAIAAARANHIAAHLIVESPDPAPGTATTIAINMTPAPGWHGYWINGGDAGFGMTVDWNLPDGVTIGALRYPVPEPLVLFGLMNHVYEHPYALLAPLSVDRSVKPGTDIAVSGTARWLACTNEICVPEQAVISVALKAGSGTITAASRETFDQWRSALPQPLDRAGIRERRGDKLRVAIPISAETAAPAPHLFIEAQDVIDYAAPQIFSRNGNWLIVEATAKGGASGPVQALLKLDKGRGLAVELRPGIVPATGDLLAPSRLIDAALFWTALGGAILGGLILNLMPCVFPILSLKALSLARSGGDARAAKVEALAYTAGAVLVALALGGALLALRAGGTQVGWAFQLQHPFSVLLLLTLAAAITLNLLGLFDLPAFAGGQKLASRPGAAGGFWTGALAAFVATPCSGPLLGAALGATLVLPAWAALPIFGGLGLGLALPFLLIGFVPALRNRLPKPGPWMATFRRWMALPMALTALALLWLLWRQAGEAGLAVGGATLILSGAALAGIGRSQRRGKPVRALLVAAALAGLALGIGSAALLSGRGGPTESIAANAFTQGALAKARATGKPVFVYFTADWCLSCKANEAGAINRSAVQKAFNKAGVITLVGDWTNGDPVLTRTLAAYGRNSVPLYLWYAPGADKPEVLPQILTPAMLVERVR